LEFDKIKPPARRKVLGVGPKQTGKKEGGWPASPELQRGEGEGIFARSCLPTTLRLRKEKAKGGFGGNFAFSLRNQIVDSPATCLNTCLPAEASSQAGKEEHRRKILFSLKEEKIGRTQNEKSKEYFSVVWRARRAVAGLASLLGVLLKKSSNINQKTPPKLEIVF